MISGFSGADAKMQIAESEPRVDLSMGRKIIKTQKTPNGNERFGESVGPTEKCKSQNLSVG